MSDLNYRIEKTHQKLNKLFSISINSILLWIGIYVAFAAAIYLLMLANAFDNGKDIYREFNKIHHANAWLWPIKHVAALFIFLYIYKILIKIIISRRSNQSLKGRM